jgi:chromosome segregation ATPase
VLAPESTHAALAQLLVALEASPAGNSNPALTPELVQALETLSREQPTATAALESLRGELTGRLNSIEERTPHPWLGPAAVAAALTALLAFTLLRKRPARSAQVLELQPVTSELSRALLPETRRQTEDIKLALRELGQHLQAAVEARGHQLSDLQDRLARVETRQQSGSEGDQAALAEATRAMEGTAERLTRENDRIRALSTELQGTLHELDSARDRLRSAELALSSRDLELERRNSALEHERAKLAALSIIIERLEPGARTTAEKAPPPAPSDPGVSGRGFALLPPTGVNRARPA